MNLQETYVIEDCLYAHLSETSFTSNSTSDQVQKLDNNLSVTLPSNWELSFDYKGNITNARFGLIPTSNTSSNPNYSLFVQIASNDYVGVYRDTSTHGMDSGRLTADNTQYHNCKISGTSSTVTWLLSGTNSATANIGWVSTKNPYFLGLYTFNKNTVYVQNIKIKPL